MDVGRVAGLDVGERLPEFQRVVAGLTVADLDVVAMAWKDTDQCPTVDSSGHIFECEMETDEGSGEINLFTVDNDRVYLVGVDGKRGETGDFSLSVNCSAYR